MILVLTVFRSNDCECITVAVYISDTVNLRIVVERFYYRVKCRYMRPSGITCPVHYFVKSRRRLSITTTSTNNVAHVYCIATSWVHQPCGSVTFVCIDMEITTKV